MPTKIEWTDETWNPVTGCSPVSAGCTNCYARRMATRLRGRYGYPQDEPFKVTLHPDRLNQPLHWRKPRMIFVCSMGDLFHKDVSFEYQLSIFGTMQQAEQHTFIILTKRPEQMKELIGRGDSDTGIDLSDSFNIWLGVSVEDQKMADERIPILLQVPAAVRVVSIEPMLGAIDLHYTYTPKWTDVHGKINSRVLFPPIHWVVCGGETGPGARPMNPGWVRKVRDQCVEAGVPFFLKSNGVWIPDMLADPAMQETHQFPDGMMMSRSTKKRADRLLDGREWNEIPERSRD